MLKGLAETKANILKIQKRKEIAVFSACLDYAAYAINYFRSVQPPDPGKRGAFWTNETGQAAGQMFSNAFREGEFVGWFLSHRMDYGPYLELANNRAHEAIRPIIQRYAGRFFEDLRRIYRDN